jgi:hypothetical protein
MGPIIGLKNSIEKSLGKGDVLVFSVSSEGLPHLVASYGTQGDAEDLSLPGSSWVTCCENDLSVF